MHNVERAKCLAVIDFVLIFPKTTAPAWTINCIEEALYDLNTSDSFREISYEISG
jgi:hypothetical protein